MTPGTQQTSVSKLTISTEPQPLSITAKGGQIIANIARTRDIIRLCVTKKCATLLLGLLVAVVVYQRHQPLVAKGTRREAEYGRELVTLLLVLHNHLVNLLYDL